MLTIWHFQLSSFLLACLYVVKRFLGPRESKHNKLSGPIGLPWLGPVWAVDATSIFLTFQKWAQKYGSIYQVTIFGQQFTVVSDPNIAKDLLAKQGALCADRPPIALIEDSKGGGRYLPFLGNNDIFHKQRKFGVLLENFTVRAEYHDRLLPQVQRLVVDLLNKTDSYDTLAERCCARITCMLAFGTAEPHAELVNNAHRIMRNLSPGGRLTNVLTPLRWLPTWLSSDKHLEKRRQNYESILWSGIFAEARERYNKGTLPPCYASYYFENEGKLGFTELQGTYGVGMMATVAVLTITAPLSRFIIAMAQHPEWQEKAQQELDEVLQGRMWELKDMPNTPVLRACVLETMRWTSPLPTGIPHRVQEDIHYDGHIIKKGTNIMACDWAMARNPSIYADPETFNPDRYLDPQSPSYREPLTRYPQIQGHHAFGFGRRICIGQELAASELLMICAALLWGFKIRPELDQNGRQKIIGDGKGKVEATPHVIPVPVKQDIEFVVRGDAKRDAILDINKTAQGVDVAVAA